jgi:membrane-associated phospholipid phosphatase
VGSNELRPGAIQTSPGCRITTGSPPRSSVGRARALTLSPSRPGLTAHPETVPYNRRVTLLGQEISEDDLGRSTETVSKPGQAPQGIEPGRAATGPKRSPILVELAGLVFLVWIYDWLQDLAPLRQKLAFEHARSLLSFETRTGLDPERALDQWMAHEHVLAFIASNFYANAIFAVTFGFAAWTWWRRPDIYRPLRNELVLANLIGFAVFWVYPVAPPRMLPGFIDVVQKAGGLGAWHTTLMEHADQFAAMPSMHLGYAVWCGLVAWRLARRGQARVAALVFAIAYPLLTALIVISTGNHYLLDVLAGTGTIVVALVVVEVAPRSVRRLRAQRIGAEPAVTRSIHVTTRDRA